MEPLNPSIQLVGPHQGSLGTLRILAGDAETRGHYFAFESETPPATSKTPLDVHAHSAYDESEYVISGAREITIGQQRWAGGPGFFALAPRHARHDLTTGARTRQAYALCERTALPADLHVHPHQEEAFYVISGEIAIESEGESTRVPTGAFVLVPRGVPHRHIVSPGSMLLAVYSPGHTVPHLAEEPEA
jgi:quercetin dioxygenase-like cupin family protein